MPSRCNGSAGLAMSPSLIGIAPVFSAIKAEQDKGGDRTGGNLFADHSLRHLSHPLSPGVASVSQVSTRGHPAGR